MSIEQQAQRKRSDGQLDKARLLIGIVAVVLLSLLVWQVFSSQDDAQEGRNLAQQVSAACSADGAAERELEAIGACQKAATVAAGSTATEQPVTQVATDDQVRAAVAAYLDKRPPQDGRTPTAAEVEAAVARVCGDLGCRGADGANGTNGDNGTDGTDGADATDDQVAAQVAAYCGEHNGCLPTDGEIQAAISAYCEANPSPCVGPMGPQGLPGPVLPEYDRTFQGLTGPVTEHCVLRDPDAQPPHYDCTQE